MKRKQNYKEPNQTEAGNWLSVTLYVKLTNKIDLLS